MFLQACICSQNQVQMYSLLHCYNWFKQLRRLCFGDWFRKQAGWHRLAAQANCRLVHQQMMTFGLFLLPGNTHRCWISAHLLCQWATKHLVVVITACHTSLASRKVDYMCIQCYKRSGLAILLWQWWKWITNTDILLSFSFWRWGWK